MGEGGGRGVGSGWPQLYVLLFPRGACSQQLRISGAPLGWGREGAQIGGGSGRIEEDRGGSGRGLGGPGVGVRVGVNPSP